MKAITYNEVYVFKLGRWALHARLSSSEQNQAVELTAASYMANDPTGTLLAWRGWSFNDRETGFLDRLQLAQIRIIRPGGNLDEQAPTEKPFHEIDGSAGLYAGLSAEHVDYGKLSFLWYENLADDHAFVLS